MKLAIAYVHPGWVHEAFATSLRRYCTTNPETTVLSARSGSLIARARNDVTNAVLHMDIDVLLWVDADMTFTNDDVDDLLKEVDDDLPILGGLYLAIDYPTGDLFTSCIPRITPEECDGTIREVIGQGMGFCAVQTKALAKIIAVEPYPYGELFDPNLGWADDASGFTIRAGKAGVRNFVHTGIRLGHIKERVI